MSAAQRHRAEALRAKYARTFAVPIDDVAITYVGDEDAQVWCGSLPIWTLGAHGAGVEEPSWVRNTKVRTW